jgi:hypothetical protein
MNSRTTKNGQMKEVNEKALCYGDFFALFLGGFKINCYLCAIA